MKKGLLIIYSGPSGVGKSTVREVFMKNEELKLAYSISMTTRSKRESEEEGKDYFFVSKERFIEAIDNGELLEYNNFVTNYYGTPKFYVEKLRNEGKNVILEIDVNGAKQVINQVSEAISIFVLPPSFEDLKERLILRNTDSLETINKRLAESKREIEESKFYKYHVINKEIDLCAKEVEDIILKEMSK